MTTRRSRLLVGTALAFGACMAGCGTAGTARYPRGQVRFTGYAADRSQSILNTTRQADDYCRTHGGGLARVTREETVYEGQFDQRVGAAATALGRVASAMGNSQAGQAGAAVASPTDYKTTIEFICQ